MNTHSHHPSQHPVGRHPDRPAHAARLMEEPSDTHVGGFSSILRRLLASWGITVLSAALFTVTAAIILYNTPDPTRWLLPASAVALAMASLCGGITAGKLSPASPIAAGLRTGGVMAALILLASFALGEGGELIPWGMGLGVLLFHLVGSALARPRKKSPTHLGSHTSRR